MTESHGNVLVQRMERARFDLHHISSVGAAAPVVDSGPPAVLSRPPPLPKNQLVRKKAAMEAAVADMHMIGNIAREMTRQPGLTVLERKGPVSLNVDRRRKDLQRIDNENERMLKRLESVRSSYSRRDHQKSYVQSRKHVALASSASAARCEIYQAPPPMPASGSSSARRTPRRAASEPAYSNIVESGDAPEDLLVFQTASTSARRAGSAMESKHSREVPPPLPRVPSAERSVRAVQSRFQAILKEGNKEPEQKCSSSSPRLPEISSRGSSPSREVAQPSSRSSSPRVIPQPRSSSRQQSQPQPQQQRSVAKPNPVRSRSASREKLAPLPRAENASPRSVPKLNTAATGSNSAAQLEAQSSSRPCSQRSADAAQDPPRSLSVAGATPQANDFAQAPEKQQEQQQQQAETAMAEDSGPSDVESALPAQVADERIQDGADNVEGEAAAQADAHIASELQPSSAPAAAAEVLTQESKPVPASSAGSEAQEDNQAAAAAASGGEQEPKASCAEEPAPSLAETASSQAAQEAAAEEEGGPAEGQQDEATEAASAGQKLDTPSADGGQEEEHTAEADVELDLTETLVEVEAGNTLQQKEELLPAASAGTATSTDQDASRMELDLTATLEADKQSDDAVEAKDNDVLEKAQEEAALDVMKQQQQQKDEPSETSASPTDLGTGCAEAPAAKEEEEEEEEYEEEYEEYDEDDFDAEESETEEAEEEEDNAEAASEAGGSESDVQGAAAVSSQPTASATAAAADEGREFEEDSHSGPQEEEEGAHNGSKNVAAATGQDEAVSPRSDRSSESQASAADAASQAEDSEEEEEESVDVPCNLSQTVVSIHSGE
mmetsp:Transcript_41460/g.97349  ORF Transcript_41460/g.97349 Transcript_41460/m.97349 type:complete len:840 (-) Transcript_41460:213-2732(-)|eukprot:CAMPEP_0178451996 /NCGR_PEP_ID=MMETSP0689_2-20121128/43992_1 /TAXON_ID=160604 /ORGANISM="Amphidinium massartii, Strain CS-259" /LENGTH=839 /DNA_ID=CAMNT_0020077639 /DNA_START=67 /DNA_END=2586 /DNA_ORIENTATION=+